MKRFILSVCVIAIGILVAVQIDTLHSQTVPGKVYKLFGWINDNSVMIRQLGCPNKSIINKENRKDNAKKDAIKLAQFSLINELLQIKDMNADLPAEKDKELAARIINIVKNGSVSEVEFDFESDCCRLTYTVTEKGLKSMVHKYIGWLD